MQPLQVLHTIFVYITTDTHSTCYTQYGLGGVHAVAASTCVLLGDTTLAWQNCAIAQSISLVAHTQQSATEAAAL
jgi:hypothetical protein